MSAKVKRIVDRTLILYVIIGVINFIVCTALMFFLFNFCGFSDHTAPLVNYGLGSVIWYLACKYILFPQQKTTWAQLLRFVVEVAVCYILSYYIIAPLASEALLRSQQVRSAFSFGGSEASMVRGNCEMSVGAIAYSIVNYFGQRYFVFTPRFEHFRRQKEQEKTP